MYRYAFACMIMFMLACTAGTDDEDTPADRRGNKEDKAVSLSRAASAMQLATGIQTLFLSSSMSEVDRLIEDPECTVAVAAGWERVRRTMPEVAEQKPLSVDRKAIARFLRLIEDRLQTPIPEAWEATLKSAKGYGRNAIWFRRVELVDRLLRTQRTSRDGGRWIVKTNGLSVSVPVEEVGIIDNYAVNLDGNLAYVALFGSRASPFSLFAIGRGDNKVNWSSEVWAGGGLVNYLGQGWHAVEISSAAETLAVFGISDDTAYVEVFDKKNGESRCRFSSAYFNAPLRE